MSNKVQCSDNCDGGESMGDKNMKKKAAPEKKAAGTVKAAVELPKAAAKPKKK